MYKCPLCGSPYTKFKDKKFINKEVYQHYFCLSCFFEYKELIGYHVGDEE